MSPDARTLPQPGLSRSQRGSVSVKQPVCDTCLVYLPSKAGQFIGARGDFVPEPICRRLARLHDQVCVLTDSAADIDQLACPGCICAVVADALRACTHVRYAQVLEWKLKCTQHCSFMLVHLMKIVLSVK